MAQGMRSRERSNAMQLRHHPLVSFYRSVANWPPVWRWIQGKPDIHPEGEVGILRQVRLAVIPPRCYLVIEHGEAEYEGCLLFDDREFCFQIYRLLEEHRDYPIEQIGGLELS
jgi:hypothetical protein